MLILRGAVILVVSCIIELLVFNFSSFTTLGLDEITISTGDFTDDEGVFVTDDIEVSDYVKNVSVTLELTNCEYANVEVTLTDEGDKYPYSLPYFRVVPGVESTGYTNIYPFDKVNTLHVRVEVPQGSSAYIDDISLNVHRPFDIKILRLLTIVLILSVLTYTWEMTAPCNKDREKRIYTGRPTWLNAGLIIVTMIAIIIIGRFLSTCNNKIVECPWPHHKQYQELAHSLENGTVILDKEVDPALLEVTNPYDTIALTAEGIFYNMDYAYYEGHYYEYFGILPELVFYYPYYIVTGQDLSNTTVMFILFVILTVGVFLGVNELIRRLYIRSKIRVSFFTYISLCIAIALFSNHVYMAARADIYNIPVMMATSLTALGLSLWLLACNTRLSAVRIPALIVGSLCMASVAGCRPQFLLYSVVAIPLFMIPGQDTEDSQKETFKSSIPLVLSFVIPYILMAAVVCWYNMARFGSIFDFGATYSLTTNDMNHRGFNMSRVLRGLYAFILQPAAYTHEFPFIMSSELDSNYMGRNLTEFVYGGTLVTNLLTLSILAPVFGMWRELSKKTKTAYVLLLVSSLVIALFDVNGAGILYRYTCDMTPGVIIAMLLMWIYLLDTGKTRFNICARAFTLLLICGIFYSFLVVVGPAGSPTLKEDSVYIYEVIRGYFRV